MYVGKGCGGRFKIHINRATNLRFKNRLIALKLLELEPILDITYFSTEDEALSEEQRLIKLYGRRDLDTGSLYNMTDGGEGASGRILSETTKERIGNKNRNPTPATREKQSAWIRSPDLKHKITIKQQQTQDSLTDAQKVERSRKRSKECLSDKTLLRMSESAKGRPPLTCPHCGKVGKVPGIRRHHFEYCKSLAKA